MYEVEFQNVIGHKGMFLEIMFYHNEEIYEKMVEEEEKISKNEHTEKSSKKRTKRKNKHDIPINQVKTNEKVKELQLPLNATRKEIIGPILQDWINNKERSSNIIYTIQKHFGMSYSETKFEVLKIGFFLYRKKGGEHKEFMRFYPIAKSDHFKEIDFVYNKPNFLSTIYECDGGTKENKKGCKRKHKAKIVITHEVEDSEEEQESNDENEEEDE